MEGFAIITSKIRAGLVACAAGSVLALGFAAAGCSADAEGAPRTGGRAGGAAGTGSGPLDDGSPFGNSVRPVAAASGDPGISLADGPTGEACPSIARTATPDLGPADVVWIIDGSGSMLDEAERLQQNLDSFTATISGAGVDTRVVLIAQLDLVPAASGLAQSGNYLFVQAMVDSHNALDVLVTSYDAYASFLRPEAHVHFIVVTDDESQYMALGTAQDRASMFRAAMDGLLAAPHTIHTVSSPGAEGDPPCIPERVTQEVLDCCLTCFFLCFDVPPAGCEHLVDDNGAPLINPLSCGFLGGASRPGVTYYALAEMTGGVAASICAEDWTHVFGALSDAVIESVPLPCAYPIPEPPPGMFFEREKVNVRFTPTGMDPDETAPLPAVQSAADCGDDSAWHYDSPDAPTEVLLCPASCDAVSSNRGGEMQIVFGCDTVVLE
ncbi:MAG: VWA domain-containing protein [Myxococcales bacterium]|nr:VWA domain-containing protein [Myxococcales bacterium]